MILSFSQYKKGEFKK